MPACSILQANIYSYIICSPLPSPSQVPKINTLFPLWISAFRLRHKFSVFSSADGSAYLEVGLNKILAVVTGPTDMKKYNEQLAKKGVLSLHVSSTAFSSYERRKKRLKERRTSEMESMLKKAFEGVIMLELYPRCEISITLHVLESDGSIVCTMVNAITLALMDAGISMSDTIAACAVGHLQGKLFVDTIQMEQHCKEAYLPMAVRSKDNNLVFFQLNCNLNINTLGDALEIGIEGCNKIKLYLENAKKSCMRNALRISENS